MYVSVISLFTCDLYSVLDMQTQVSVYNYNIYTKFTCNYNIYLKTYIMSVFIKYHGINIYYINNSTCYIYTTHTWNMLYKHHMTYLMYMILYKYMCDNVSTNHKSNSE